MYLAHRTEDGREQPLLEHLAGTARRADAFAAPFGAGALARQIGLAHDIGKYSEAFQQRIRGAPVQTDHSTAGAQEIVRICGAMAAFCIAGHHGGLPDGGSQYDVSSQPTLAARLKRKVEPYAAFRGEIALRPADFRMPQLLGRGGFTVSFWTRMLFSCLVDADYLDTEAFMRGNAPPRGDYDTIDDLLELLEAHTAPWWDAKTPLNRARCSILRACLNEGGVQPIGLFTLTVPTGGGKTVSSLAFALRHAKRHGLRRIIYVIPYTSIIEQTADVFRGILGERNVLEHHSGVDYNDDNHLENERKKLAAENWDMPVVVTTAVQFFESLFASKPSRCRKLHNLAQSVIIFDEAQTLPLPYLKPCLRAIAELTVNYGASCVLCTATQPALDPLFREILPTLSCHELCPPVDPAVFRRARFSHLGKLNDEALAARLNAHGQALCIVGTRRQAQAVFALLEREGSFHLSTLMTPAHRRAVLEQVRARLKAGLPCRVVSTSLIEAGVDVDFPVVYRAEAGLDSEIQAAGRCNREGKRTADESYVYLFTPDDSYTAHLPDMLRRPLETARAITNDFSALDAPQTIERYFAELYQLSGTLLDHKQIIRRFEETQNGSYPFAATASEFHLIENETRTVLIPIGEKAAALAERLRRGERSRALFRQAGRHSVNVYDGDFEALDARGALEILDEDAVVLRDASLYSSATGLALVSDGGLGFFC